MACLIHFNSYPSVCFSPCIAGAEVVVTRPEGCCIKFLGLAESEAEESLAFWEGAGDCGYTLAENQVWIIDMLTSKELQIEGKSLVMTTLNQKTETLSKLNADCKK